MLLSVFSSLYELVCKPNQNYPEYRDSIFSSVGLLTLIISIVISIIFYIGLGRWKPIWYTLVHWIITLVLVTGIGFGLALLQTKSIIQLIDSYTIQFAIFNSIFSAIYFIVLSLFLKKASIFAKKTPF